MQRLRRLTAYPTDPPSPLNCSQLDTSLDFDVNWLYKAAISPEGEPFSSCRLPLLAKCNAFSFFPIGKARFYHGLSYTRCSRSKPISNKLTSIFSVPVCCSSIASYLASVRACVRRRRRRRRRRKRARRKSPIISKFVTNK